MPFTPFHFGAHSCVALTLQKKIDVPAFILANVVVDIEPLVVILFNLKYPLHGYAHTFLGGIIIGSLWGVIAYKLRRPLSRVMRFLKLPYAPSLFISMMSGAAGACLHILFDAPLYSDIRPFYPLSLNPMYGLLPIPSMYLLCVVLFVPAIVLYFGASRKNNN